MKEAYLYKKLSNNKVRCLNCSHYCLLSLGQQGICGVKKNIKGKLIALNYNKAVAINIDPIEKKPFFHFFPGSNSLSIAAVGCNLSCQNCQNYDISQQFKNKPEIPGNLLTPEQIVKIALEKKLPSISYTYSDPSAFSEYALDIMKLAKKAGIKNAWVSNGFWSKELFKMVSPYLAAVNIDLKSFSDKFYQNICRAKLKPILETLKRIKKEKIWLEITTLVIPTLNDKEKTFKDIARFIKHDLGSRTPWHISRFSPDISWKLKNLPDTPLETLKKAYYIGRKSGLKYVYIGNVPGLPAEDTFCPKCNSLLIDRTGYEVKRYDKKGSCPKCKFKLDIIDL